MTQGRGHKEVMESLTNIPPINDMVTSTMEALRNPAKVFAGAILDLVPTGREQSLAITKVEEAVMWAIKGIVLHQSEVK